MPTTTKTERLEMRLTAQQRRTLERAAALSDRTLTDFIVRSALQAAEAALAAQAVPVIALSARDSLAFAEALLNPPPAADALVAAARASRARVRPL